MELGLFADDHCANPRARRKTRGGDREEPLPEAVSRSGMPASATQSVKV